MCALETDSILTAAPLAEFYRFALLLTGEATSAERILGAALRAGHLQLSQMRNDALRYIWIAKEVRRLCAAEGKCGASAAQAPRLLRLGGESAGGDAPVLLGIEAYIVARRFQAVPEPSRSALALLYLDLFTAEEIAKVLDMRLESLCETIERGRQALREALQTEPARNGAEAGDDPVPSLA